MATLRHPKRRKQRQGKGHKGVKSVFILFVDPCYDTCRRGDMSRPLRIEYPGAWYHAMNRGTRSESIFLGSDDYLRFLHVLEDGSVMWNVRIAAFCMMPNHYHLLVQTPDANLSRFMRHVDGVYTQRFNRAHRRTVLVPRTLQSHSGGGREVSA